MVVGDTLQNLADHGAANDFYYLAVGNAAGGDAVFTAGKIMVKFYGHPVI